MNRSQSAAAALSCALILSSVYSAAQAAESFRVKRPAPNSVQTTDSSSADSNGNTGNDSSRVFSGSVQTNELLNQPPQTVDRETYIKQHSILAVQRWRAVEFEQERELMAEHGNTDSHHGFMHHLASTVGTVGGTAAILAVSYGAGRPPSFASVRNRSKPPGITIEPGHCPAAFDPAFQVPYSWWTDLANEQASDPIYSDPWQAWLQSVREVFASHNNELRSSGVASMHVIINPDGSIYNATPYRGEGGGIQNSSGMLKTLARIIAEVRNFPPFPMGTHVRCYHLIFEARNY